MMDVDDFGMTVPKPVHGVESSTIYALQPKSPSYSVNLNSSVCLRQLDICPFGLAAKFIVMSPVCTVLHLALTAQPLPLPCVTEGRGFNTHSDHRSGHLPVGVREVKYLSIYVL